MVPRSRMGMLVWKRSWAWMSRRDVREWYGYAFGLPDRHPTVVSLWRGLLPMRSSRDVRWMFGGTCGAWWFENWIVDASKGN